MSTSPTNRGRLMKRRILAFILITMLTVAGCGEKETKDQETTNDTINETIDDVETDLDEMKESNDWDETDVEKQENIITIYYMQEDTENIVSKEITVSGDVSKGIIQELKKAKVLSEECELQETTVDQEYHQVHIDINKEFGEYFRSMGTTGSELILKCLVLSYQDTYNCDGVLITENGKVFDTGHAVLDGYISYK